MVCLGSVTSPDVIGVPLNVRDVGILPLNLHPPLGRTALAISSVAQMASNATGTHGLINAPISEAAHTSGRRHGLVVVC
jgi:hypothetical protein